MLRFSLVFHLTILASMPTSMHLSLVSSSQLLPGKYMTAIFGFVGIFYFSASAKPVVHAFFISSIDKSIIFLLLFLIINEQFFIVFPKWVISKLYFLKMD